MNIINKYVVWCNQRYTYFGGKDDINDTEHFNSLEEIKDMLIDYHNVDIEEEDHKALYKMNAEEIANMFDWSIERTNNDIKRIIIKNKKGY